MRFLLGPRDQGKDGFPWRLLNLQIVKLNTYRNVTTLYYLNILCIFLNILLIFYVSYLFLAIRRQL